jgi:hypothetical protein
MTFPRFPLKLRGLVFAGIALANGGLQ